MTDTPESTIPIIEYAKLIVPIATAVGSFFLGKLYEVSKNAKESNRKIGTDLVICLYQMKAQGEELVKLQEALKKANSFYDDTLIKFKTLLAEVQKNPNIGQVLQLEDFCSVNLHVVIKIMQLPQSLLKVVTYDQSAIARSLDIENRLTSISLKIARRDLLHQQLATPGYNFEAFQSRMKEVKDVNEVLISECKDIIPIIRKLENSIMGYLNKNKKIEWLVGDELRSYKVD